MENKYNNDILFIADIAATYVKCESIMVSREKFMEYLEFMMLLNGYEWNTPHDAAVNALIRSTHISNDARSAFSCSNTGDVKGMFEQFLLFNTEDDAVKTMVAAFDIFIKKPE